MTPPNTIYSVLLLIAGTICLLVAIIIFQTRRAATGSLALITLLLALAWWDITYAIFWAGAPGPTKYFWLDITYIGIVTVPAAFLVFSLQFTNHQDWLKRPLAIFIYLEPIFVLVSLFTDSYHGLFFAGKRVADSAVILDAGPVFWLNVAYSYSLMLLSITLIVRAYLRSSGIYRKQLGVIFLANCFVWFNSIILVAGLNPLPGADNTPFSFTIAAIAFAFAIGGYQLLDIIPVARESLIEKMTDGVLVIDTQNRIVDMNPAAQNLLKINTNKFGEPVEEAIQEWSYYEKGSSNFAQIQSEIELAGEPKKYVDMQVTSIMDDKGGNLGRLIILHDITKRKQVETDERQQRILAEALRNTAEALNSTLDFDGVMEKILENVECVVPIDSANIALVENHKLHYVRFHGYQDHKISEKEMETVSVSLDSSPILKKVFATGEPIIIPDTYADPDWIITPIGAWIRSYAVMPIRVKEEVVGVLNLDSAVLGLYTSEHIYRLRAFADQVAIAVENARLFATAEREIKERKHVEEKFHQLSQAVEQSPVSIVITDTRGNIEYVNPRFTQVTGYSAEEAIGQNPRILKTDKTPAETHRELWNTVTSGKEWHGEFANHKKNGELYYESALISPIIDANGVVTHYLAVKEDITGRKKAEEEILLLQNELREQAIRDPLTGLYNRRYLKEFMEHELARAAREKYSICFVMIDIDHFKRVNDTYGHDAGDSVLRKLATQLQSQARIVDIVCRYGGEEFLAILPNVTADIAFQITQRWRQSFVGSTLPLQYNRVKATISCGISEYPVHGTIGSELIILADKAMYQAKSRGRNQVVIWRAED